MPGIPDIALGADELLYVSLETTYGVWKRPVAADGVRVKEINFGRDQERVTRDDKLGTRSHTERIKRKKTVEWTVRAYLVPSGVDPSVTATPPDIGDLLKALFGAETVNAGTDVTYSLVRDQDISLSLHRIDDHFAESLTGCVPNNATFRWSGTDEPEVEFSGFGKNWVITNTSLVAGGAPILGTQINIRDGENALDINSVVHFVTTGGADLDNGGIGYHISAVDADQFLVIAGENDDIDFVESAAPLIATLTPGVYTTPALMAAEIKNAMDAAGLESYTTSWNPTTRKFTILHGGAALSLLWLTGASGPGGTNTSAASLLGYSDAADDTGVLSYSSDFEVWNAVVTTDEAGGWEAAIDNDAEIAPFFPTPTLQGHPATCLVGSVAVGSEYFNTTEGSIEYNGNMSARNDFFGYEDSQGFSVSGRRDVNLSYTSYLEQSYARRVKEFLRFDETHNVVITFGDTPGDIVEISMPYLEFDNNPFTVPEQEEATINFTGMALDPVAPFEGEINIVFK